MSTYFFLLELVADFTTYFVFFLLVIYLIDRFLFKLNNSKAITVVFWIMLAVSSLLLIFNTVIIYENEFFLKRNFTVTVIKTGLKLF